jgi:hypothetical protein
MCGKNVEFVNVNPGGTKSDHCALKVYNRKKAKTKAATLAQTCLFVLSWPPGRRFPPFKRVMMKSDITA